MLVATGPLGTFLKEVKEKAAKEIGEDQAIGARAVVAVELDVKGTVGGNLEWKRTKSWDCVGTITAGLGFEIQEKVELEGRIFLVSAGAGAGIGLKGSDGKKSTITGKWTPITADDSPSITGQLFFNGLAVFYCLYAYVGVSDTSTRSETAANSSRSNRSKRSKRKGALKGERKEEEMLHVFCEPKKWPENKRPMALTD